MKVHGVHREWVRPFWVHCKKHSCPVCSSWLAASKTSKIVDTASAEAAKFPTTDLCGYVRFVWTVFICTGCGRTFSVNEIRTVEKDRRKAGRKS